MCVCTDPYELERTGKGSQAALDRKVGGRAGRPNKKERERELIMRRVWLNMINVVARVEATFLFLSTFELNQSDPKTKSAHSLKAN